MTSDFNLKKRSLQMKKELVNKMESTFGPNWTNGNIQVAEVILDKFEPLVGQTVNDPRFVDFLIDSLLLIKKELK
jgi:hypothetical protein